MSHTAASPSPPTASAAHSCNRSSGTSHSTTSADAEDYLNAPLSLTITTSNTAAASASTAATTTLPDQHDATTSSPLPDSILTKALRASIGDDGDDGVDYFGTVRAGSAAHVGSAVGVGSTALVGSRSVEEKETNAAASSSIVGGNGNNGFATTPGYSQYVDVVFALL